MALNEGLDWSQVGAISTGSGSVRNAFQLAFGDPTKETAKNHVETPRKNQLLRLRSVGAAKLDEVLDSNAPVIVPVKVRLKTFIAMASAKSGSEGNKIR